MYRDYLDMCEKLRYDLRNSFVLYPKKIKEAHDITLKRFKQQENKIHSRMIMGAYAELKRVYGFQSDGLMIVPPRSAAEIIKEGQTLHHCVGTYVERVAEKECVILFLRREEAPGKPFCTIELRNGKVVQARSMSNNDPPPDAKAFLTLWKKRVLEAPRRQDQIEVATLANAA